MLAQVQAQTCIKPIRPRLSRGKASFIEYTTARANDKMMLAERDRRGRMLGAPNFPPRLCLSPVHMGEFCAFCLPQWQALADEPGRRKPGVNYPQLAYMY